MIQLNKWNIWVSAGPKNLKNIIQDKNAEIVKKKQVMAWEYLTSKRVPINAQYKKPTRGKNTIQ